MFEYFLVGLPLAAITCVWITFAGPFLLPDAAAPASPSQGTGTLEKSRSFICCFRVLGSSSYVGKTVAAGGVRMLNDLNLLAIGRGDATIPALDSTVIKENDRWVALLWCSVAMQCCRWGRVGVRTALRAAAKHRVFAEFRFWKQM